MRRLIALFFSIFILVGGVMAQQMSDDQVVQYVKEAQRTGKSQKQMTTELLRRGVTKEQVARIQKKYAEHSTAADGVENKPSQLRERTSLMTDGKAIRGTSYEEAELEEQKEIIDLKRDAKATPEAPGSNIFGHSLFSNRNLSFEPSANLATPVNYRLGPGDEVIIDIWGASENTIRQTISPEGTRSVRLFWQKVLLTV